MAGQPDERLGLPAGSDEAPEVALILIGVSFVGGIGGGLLLLATSNAAFSKLILAAARRHGAVWPSPARCRRLSAGSRRGCGMAAASEPGSIGGAYSSLFVAIYGGFSAPGWAS